MRYRTAWMSARRRANNAAGSVVFWKDLAVKRFVEIQRLNERISGLATDLAEAGKGRGMGNLVPTIAVEAIGSRDRDNCNLLAARLSEAHATIDRLRSVCAAQDRVIEECNAENDRLHKQLAERNPS